WITAIVPVASGWMIGTYGAGVFSYDHNGFHAMEIGTAKYEVNPGAMLATEAHVFAGSLGQGLYIYDRAHERWRVVPAGLPSSNVTALAAGNGFLYVGTDNGIVRIREASLDQ